MTGPAVDNEVITHDPNDRDAWRCICGNEPTADGFYPSNQNGNEIEPVKGWNELYVCVRCGRIIDQNTLRVVGRNPHPKLLD